MGKVDRRKMGLFTDHQKLVAHSSLNSVLSGKPRKEHPRKRVGLKPGSSPSPLE